MKAQVFMVILGLLLCSCEQQLVSNIPTTSNSGTQVNQKRGYSTIDLAAEPDLRMNSALHTVALQLGHESSAEFAKTMHKVPYAYQESKERKHCVKDPDMQLDIFAAGTKQLILSVKGGECASTFIPAGDYDYQLSDTRADTKTAKMAFFHSQFGPISKDDLAARIASAQRTQLPSKALAQSVYGGCDQFSRYVKVPGSVYISQSVPNATAFNRTMYAALGVNNSLQLSAPTMTQSAPPQATDALDFTIYACTGYLSSVQGTYLLLSNESPSTPSSNQGFLTDSATLLNFQNATTPLGSIVLGTTNPSIPNITSIGGATYNPNSKNAVVFTYKHLDDNINLQLTSNNFFGISIYGATGTTALLGTTFSSCTPPPGYSYPNASPLPSAVISQIQCAGLNFGKESEDCNNSNSPALSGIACVQACTPQTVQIPPQCPNSSYTTNYLFSPTNPFNSQEPNPVTLFQFSDEQAFIVDNTGCEGCNLASVTLTSYNLVGVNLKNAILANANFNTAYMPGADLTGADASRAQFVKANFFQYTIAPSVQGATLKNANFAGANLNGLQLQGADVSCASFASAMLINASFDGAKAPIYCSSGALDFSSSILAGTDFSHFTLHDPPTGASGTPIAADFINAVVPEAASAGCYCLLVQSGKSTNVNYPFQVTPVVNFPSTDKYTRCPSGGYGPCTCIPTVTVKMGTCTGTKVQATTCTAGGNCSSTVPASPLTNTSSFSGSGGTTGTWQAQSFTFLGSAT